MLFVRYICAGCFMLTVMLFVTPLQQFFKIPSLLEHYKEHKADRPEITFADFIYMHYIGDDGVASDESKDMQLPFKKSDRGPSLLVAYNSTIIELPAPVVYKLIVKYPLCNNHFAAQPYSGTLFKPPRA